MTIQLRPLSESNWRQAVDLHTSQEQLDLWQQYARLQDKYYVSANVVTLADANFYATTEMMGLYAGDKMVGFVAYEPTAEADEPNEGYAINRFMIEFRYQGMGYGRRGLEAVIAHLTEKPDCKKIWTSVIPENTVARNLYKRLGFRPTGEMDEGEIELVLRI